MKRNPVFSRIVALALCVMMGISMLPMQAFATIDYDTSVSSDYFTVLSSKEYPLAPGATETELVLDNAEGNDRKVAHVFEVDPTEETLEIMPGYYGIDKLDPENLNDKTYWTDAKVTDTVAYYEDMGYNVVGAMNTALAYDSNAPYGYMVWDGVVLGTPTVHPGAKTYLAINYDGSAELRSMNTPLTGQEKTAISANFDWLVKDGALVSKTVERTSSDASRSMIGIKADGTIVFCQVDGRNAPISSGLSNYEMGEMMLALGCVNAVNCDGGGSSTFVSKRAGEAANVMRSVPSDGSERPTINSVIIATKAAATGVFARAQLETPYDYIAPGASMTVSAVGLDTNEFAMDVPEEAQWTAKGGTMNGSVFTADAATGKATIQLIYNGNVVGEKVVNVVHPEVFKFALDDTVLPYGKSMNLEMKTEYGADNWAVCVDGAYSLALSDETAATLTGTTLSAANDESKVGVTVTATYLPDTAKVATLNVSYGKGSEIIYDFEDGDTAGFMGFVDAKAWSKTNGVNNTLVGSSPLAGQFNEQISSTTFVASAANGGQVKSGDYALAWSLDNTDATFGNWSYNVLFNVGETIVLRDVANGQNATTLGMWLYIPEGAAGLAFQSQFYVKNADGSYSCKQDHFMFTTVSGVKKNLNSCTEADIPESRWVYASVDISKYDYLCTPVANDESNSRSPSFIRTYVKPTTPAVHTFYIDDITLDYSSAVDDRVLPTITNVTYASGDTSADLANNLSINGQTVGFSAQVSDDKALAPATGTILVDGVAVPTTVSGKTMATSSDMTLNPGKHTVTFEIQDTLGNLAKVTRTFTIAGDAVVTLSGHNDSGKLPEYDSVYYVDINVADLSAVDSLTTTLKLQTANTWELEGIQAAAGFKVTASLDKATESIATITVERENKDIRTFALDTTLVSIPVRVWSWDGVDNTIGQSVDPEEQFATGYCPIVTIDCDVVKGLVNGTDYFGGAISVETKLKDTENPWHYHDAELVEQSMDATCTEAGYTGRTYCDTCQSVIGWGKTEKPLGHTYEMVDGILQCHCDDLFTGTWTDGKDYIDGVLAYTEDGWTEDGRYIENGVKYTGVCKVPAPDGSGEFYYNFGEDGISQGKYTGIFYDEAENCYRYALAGALATGWRSIGTDWYYISTSTQKVVTGSHVVNGITYIFDENGVLTSGVWVETSEGMKYSEGPAFSKRVWKEIDGKTYYFGRDGIMYTGVNFVKDNPDTEPYWYDFGEDGAVEMMDGEPVLWDYEGVYSVGGNTYFVQNGQSVGGLREFNGDYYCFSMDNNLYTPYAAIKDKSYYVHVTNGLEKDGYAFQKGMYTFDAEGKMDTKTGVYDGLYYRNGTTVSYAGLIEYDGHFYYINDGAKPVAGRDYHITKLNGVCYEDGTPVKKGTYTFDADGKMVIRNGLVDGVYYVNNLRTPYYGLIEQDGFFYYINDGAKPVAGRDYYITKTNDLEYNGEPIKKGTYTFDAEGKMVIRNGLVDGYYYENNVKKAYAGLIEQDGSFYYINDGAKPVAGKNYYITKTNGLEYNGEPIKKGTYTFDAEGKMIIG